MGLSILNSRAITSGGGLGKHMSGEVMRHETLPLIPWHAISVGSCAGAAKATLLYIGQMLACQAFQVAGAIWWRVTMYFRCHQLMNGLGIKCNSHGFAWFKPITLTPAHRHCVHDDQDIGNKRGQNALVPVLR